MEEEKWNKLVEMIQNINDKVNQLDNKIDNVEQRLNQKMDSLRKEILDQQFLFEEEYGQKIDAIFDAVTLELDKI